MIDNPTNGEKKQEQNLHKEARPQRPSSRITITIIASLLFPPLGIPAAIFSSQVNALYALGDDNGAKEASVAALSFAVLGIVVGILALLALIRPLMNLVN